MKTVVYVMNIQIERDEKTVLRSPQSTEER